MAKISDVFDMLDEWAPFSTALEFDNAGLMVGNMDDMASRVAVALDLTDDTLEAAKEQGCDLIVTHHPAIFTPLKALDTHSLVYRAAASGIGIISAHTNLDAADGGVNDVLAYTLAVADAQPLIGTGEPPMARIGHIEPLSDRVLAEWCKKALGVGAVKYVPTDRIIHKEIGRAHV